MRQQVVVSKDAKIAEIEKDNAELKIKIDRLQKILDEDRVTRKGLNERYMKEQEDVVSEGIHMEEAGWKKLRQALIKHGDTKYDLLYAK